MPSVNANITGNIGTKTGNFSLVVTFGIAVEGFTDGHISVSPMTAVSSFSVTGSGETWRINFVMLPNIDETEITVRLSTTMAVTVGNNPPVDHTISPTLEVLVVIVYDSTSEILAVFRESEYNIVNESLEIKTPIDFFTATEGHSEIIGLDKTDFHLLRLDGSDIYDFIYWLTGPLTNDDLPNDMPLPEGVSERYFLHIVPQQNRVGTIQLDITGTVLKLDGVTNEIVAINSISIPYSTQIPRLIDYEIPLITEGIWDVYIEFNNEVTGIAIDDFIKEGGLPDPAIYRYDGSGSVNIHNVSVSQSADLDNLTDDQGFSRDPNIFDLMAIEGDWIKLTDTSGVSPNQNEIDALQNDDFRENGNTTPSKYFLLRYVNTQSIIDNIDGVYNLTLTPRSVRGPDGR